MKIDFFACRFFHKPDDLRRQLREYQNFNSHSEIYWLNISDELSSMVHNELANAEIADHEEIVEAYTDELITAQATAPKFHRESTFVSIIAQIEHSLLELCSLFNQEALGKDNNFQKLSMKSAIDNIINYMHKNMQFDVDSMKDELSYFKSLKKIRNNIVHHNGLLLNNIKALEGFCCKYTHFKIINKFIYLNQHAIPETITFAFSLIEKMETQIDLFRQRHQQEHGVYEHQLLKPAL